MQTPPPRRPGRNTRWTRGSGQEGDQAFSYYGFPIQTHGLTDCSPEYSAPARKTGYFYVTARRCASPDWDRLGGHDFLALVERLFDGRLAAGRSHTFDGDFAALGGLLDLLLIHRVPSAHGHFAHLVGGSELGLEFDQRAAVRELVRHLPHLQRPAEAQQRLAGLAVLPPLVRSETRGGGKPRR